MNRRLKIYFDGGCRPNPGPIEVAVVVRGVAHFHGDLGEGTNTEAEWYALLKAAELAQTLGPGPFELIGDALGVIEQAKGKARCRSHTASTLQQSFAALICMLLGTRVRWTPRSQNLAGIALAARHQIRPPGP